MKLDDVVQLTTKQGETLTVRRLRPADREALCQFGGALSREMTARFLPHLYDEATLAPLLARSEAGDDLTLGVFQDARIVGYFFLHLFKHPFPLLGIGILDDFQGTGLGRQMMLLLIDEAVKNGNDGIDLTTLPTNDRAFNLYCSVGFRQIGFVENPLAGGGVTVERALRYIINPRAAAPGVFANGRQVKT
jgi:ribosomal protein S18 acetylase RimI-like enzyme